MNLLQETKLFQTGQSQQKRPISEYARWVRRENQTLVGIDVALNQFGASVALKQTYRSSAGTNSMLFFPDKRTFDQAHEKLATTPSALPIENVLCQIVGGSVEIVAVERAGAVEFLAKGPMSSQTKKLRTSKPILFLYPAFDAEGLHNLSVLRETQDEWVALPVYETSLVTGEEIVLREPLSLELLPVFSNEVYFEFKLDATTNTTVIVSQGGECAIRASAENLGIFGRALKRNGDDSLKDIRLYAYAPIQISRVDLLAQKKEAEDIKPEDRASVEDSGPRQTE